MNNNKPLNQMIDELKPEEYTDFVHCMKENFGTTNCVNQEHYKLIKSLLCDQKNKASFNSLSRGCQIAAMIYVEAFERQQIRAKEISDLMENLD